MPYKKQLAFEIVKQLNSLDEAEKAQAHFEETVQKGKLPTGIEEVKLSDDDEPFVNEDLLVALNLANSKTEAKRLFEQGGVSVDSGRVTLKDNVEITDGMVLKVGKRKVIKLIRPS